MKNTTNTAICEHCERAIVNDQGTWVDPHATGDDIIWRETCDANHGSFTAYHEPEDIAAETLAFAQSLMAKRDKGFRLSPMELGIIDHVVERCGYVDSINEPDDSSPYWDAFNEDEMRAEAERDAWENGGRDRYHAWDHFG